MPAPGRSGVRTPSPLLPNDLELPMRCGLLGIDEEGAEPGGEGDPERNLAASAVSGQAAPAGPQWVSRLAPLEPHALAHDSRCARRSRGPPRTRRPLRFGSYRAST
jgi:hypothetical protein